ncbi:YceI family protein [Endozoicomonas sp. 8E]|uniref:YceI family protein n=1 Tax=Endozoicomonas sp. 8E TaxID=3035692 RepID=UPI002938ECBE|nr:YceI family protein [Endozoicomonas sp. 8E]WOG26629.1 YceI family protein [Endozoicomonas sp. 8E]
MRFQPAPINSKGKKMKKILLFLLVLTACGLSNAAQYELNRDISRVSFATVKLEYVIEPASISSLTGSINETGLLTLDIPISGIDTGIGIRNERLNKLFFQSDLFPSAKVSAQISKSLLALGTVVKQLTVPAKVTLYGQTQELEFPVNVVKCGDLLSVASTEPVIIRASQFGVPAKNLTELAKTVGQIPISETVPVNFSLVFSK